MSAIGLFCGCRKALFRYSVELVVPATHCNTLQHTATHCNTLQHTATHCNTLQNSATLCNTLCQQVSALPYNVCECDKDLLVSATGLFRKCCKALLRYRAKIAVPSSFALPYNICARDKHSFVSAIGLFCECSNSLCRCLNEIAMPASFRKCKYI